MSEDSVQSPGITGRCESSDVGTKLGSLENQEVLLCPELSPQPFIPLREARNLEFCEKLSSFKINHCVGPDQTNDQISGLRPQYFGTVSQAGLKSLCQLPKLLRL